MKTTLQQRFLKAMGHSGKTKADIARACDVTQAAVYRWTEGDTDGISAINAYTAARCLGVNPVWLGTGFGEMLSEIVTVSRDGEPKSDFVPVPEFEVRFSEDNPNDPIYEETSDSYAIYYKKEWFANRGIDPGNCRRLKVRGDSMLPVLYDGDKVLVDCTPNQDIISGKVYAFAFGRRLRIKRLAESYDGSVTLLSSNPDIPRETIPASERERFVLIGRVVNRSGDGPF